MVHGTNRNSSHDIMMTHDHMDIIVEIKLLHNPNILFYSMFYLGEYQSTLKSRIIFDIIFLFLEILSTLNM